MNWEPVLKLAGKSWKPREDVLASLSGAPFTPDDNHRFIFQWDESFYRERVEMVDFVGCDRVLDAGCGFGQWAAALSRYNREVVAVDRSPKMLEITKILCQRWQAPNVTIQSVELPEIDLPDESFDLIWCSGVIMFVPREPTLETFHRLLKPGGRLYIEMNGRGRWLFKLLKSIFDGNRVRFRSSWRALRQGKRPGARPHVADLRDIPALCDHHGFQFVGAAPDGCLDLSGQQPPRQRPMFARRFLLLDNNIEFVVRKP